MRGWLSIFCKFWKYVKLQDLKVVAPMIEANINAQEKKQKTAKQAKVFSSEELLNFYSQPKTANNLGDMAYAVMGISFGGRGAEIIEIEFKDVTRTVSVETGETQIKVSYQRKKEKGVPARGTALITGAIEVVFPIAERVGKYFRKLRMA
jgi:hypothetical protein